MARAAWADLKRASHGRRADAGGARAQAGSSPEAGLGGRQSWPAHGQRLTPGRARLTASVPARLRGVLPSCRVCRHGEGGGQMVMSSADAGPAWSATPPRRDKQAYYPSLTQPHAFVWRTSIGLPHAMGPHMQMKHPQHLPVEWKPCVRFSVFPDAAARRSSPGKGCSPTQWSPPILPPRPSPQPRPRHTLRLPASLLQHASVGPLGHGPARRGDVRRTRAARSELSLRSMCHEARLGRQTRR